MRTGQTGNTALLYQRHQVPSISETCAMGLAQKPLVTSLVTRKGDRRREEGEKQRREKGLKEDVRRLLRLSGAL